MDSSKSDNAQNPLLNSLANEASSSTSSSTSSKSTTQKSNNSSNSSNTEALNASNEEAYSQRLEKLFNTQQGSSESSDDDTSALIKQQQEAQIDAKVDGSDNDDKQNLAPTKDNQNQGKTLVSGIKQASSGTTTPSSATSQKSISSSNSVSSEASNSDSNSQTQSSSVVSSSANSNSDNTSNSSSDSDPALSSQGQKNEEKNQHNNADSDLQDFTSPNIFIERAQAKHQQLQHDIWTAYQEGTLNNTATVRSILHQNEAVFSNLCWGFSQLVKDNQNRNNQVEQDTENMQKKASQGEKTIDLWEREGIFADLERDAKTIVDAYKSPYFQAFLKNSHLDKDKIQVPEPLKEKGEVLQAKLKKQQQQANQKKGDNQK